VKLVVQVKLLPSAGQAEALRATLHEANDAANRVSKVAHEKTVFRNFALRKHTYEDIRAAGLGSQAAQHVIKKVAGAYRALHSNIKNGNYGKPGSKRRLKVASKPIEFRPDAAQPYDQRNLSFALDARTISLRTLAGRLKDVPFTCPAGMLKALTEFPRGESDLLYRDGMWLLIVTVDVAEAELNSHPAGWLGAGLGIVNIATTSDGERMAGRGINRYRRRQLALRRKLQAKQTRSAKRVLTRQRRKEQRRARDINHCIAKRIVTEAERTGRGIALEDLTGIRARVRLRKPQRVTLHSWAFAQLGQFIAYKAAQAGVPLVYVDPAYTSQACSRCGHISKKNRPDQATFRCTSCGFAEHADVNAARNIASRGVLGWADVMQPHAA
jgi:IS605 OrfB family transposase